MKFLFSLLILVALTESCSASKNTMENKSEDTPQQNQLSGTYTIHTIENDASVLKTLTLTFNENTNKISGFAGCNSFFGDYAVSENKITFTNIGASKKYCQQNLNTVERNFIKALNKSNTFKIKGDILMLLEDNTILLKANKKTVSKKSNHIETNNNTQVITYKTTSRGSFDYISISGAKISISKDTYLKKVDKYTCDKKDWEELVGLLKQVDILNLQKLDAPTEKRLYDGAAHATLDIMLGDMIVRSPSFDHGYPPKEIEALVNKVLSIKENAIK